MRAIARLALAALACLVIATPCLAQSSAGKPQLIWFAPRDQEIEPFDSNRSGSIDYMDLFTESSPWAQAASHVQIFKFYGTQFLPGNIPNPLTDDQLRQALADLKRRNIALAVETGVLTGPADGHCGNVEGFYGENSLALATRIKELGGVLDYFAMDGPFRSGSGSCNWTPQQIAENAAANVAIIKSIFPNVKVGDIEDGSVQPDSLPQLAVWLEAWEAAAGEPLAFLHADDSSAPIPSLDALRQLVQQHQIPFGIIYDGLPSDESDRDWVDHARDHYESIETVGKVIPDHALFQSWNPYPKHVLPESDPTTLTHLIDTYFRTRTALSLVADQEHVAGRLADNQGTPIPAAPITVTLRLTSGPGLISSYTLTGTIPTSISKGQIQICVNTCGNSQGTNDANIYSFQYADSGASTNLDFSNGLNGWGVQAGGTAHVLLASDASGNAMRISATPTQETWVNSPGFSVTPGSDFTLTMQARVLPGSDSSASFALIFLADQEVSRATLAFGPGAATIGVVQTGTDGTFGLAYTPPIDTGFDLEASYSGSDTLWPAFAITSVPADLAITMAHSPEPAVVGRSLTFTLTVANNGAGVATGVTVSDSLVAGLTFVSATSSQGNCSATSNIVCDLGTLNSGSVATVTVVVKPTQVGGISNTAGVSANETDPNLSNNSATQTATAIPMPLPDLVGNWQSAAQTCKSRRGVTTCSINGNINVVNKGTGTAGACVARLYLSDDPSFDAGDIPLGEVKVPSLKAGGQRLLRVKSSLPAGSNASGKFVIAVLDADDVVVEADESNNNVVTVRLP